MNKQDNQRIRLTKRLLQEALLRLLETRNISKVSVTELCREAGINRATFYHHYGSQYDVLSEMEQTMIDHLQTMIDNGIARGDVSPQQQLELICSYLRENSGMSKLFFGNSSVGSDFAKKLFSTFQNKEYLVEHLCSDYDEESNRLMFIFLETGTFSLIQSWLLEDISKSAREVSDLIWKMLLPK